MSQSADAQSSGTADRDLRTVNPRMMKWVSGIAFLLGVWLIGSPFVMESTDTAVWNNAIVGAAIVILAGFNYYRMMTDQWGHVGVSSLIALLGLWAVIAPFVIEMGSDELTWSTAIVGLIVAILSGYNAYAHRKATSTATGARV